MEPAGGDSRVQLFPGESCEGCGDSDEREPGEREYAGGKMICREAASEGTAGLNHYFLLLRGRDCHEHHVRTLKPHLKELKTVST